jgi:hypothetical protein
MNKLASPALGAALAFTLIAAKPPSDPLITLDQSSPVASGSTVSFTVVAPAAPGKSHQEVSVTCAGYLDVTTDLDPTWPDPQFTLTGAGAGLCTAQLYYYTWQGQMETGVVYEASTTFTVR